MVNFGQRFNILYKKRLLYHFLEEMSDGKMVVFAMLYECYYCKSIMFVFMLTSDVFMNEYLFVFQKCKHCEIYLSN